MIELRWNERLVQTSVMGSPPFSAPQRILQYRELVHPDAATTYDGGRAGRDWTDVPIVRTDGDEGKP